MKNPFVILLRNADAGIRHGEQDGIFLGQERSRDETDFAFSSELQRIGEKIPKNLRDLSFVGQQKRNVFRILHDQLHIGVQQERAQHPTECAEQRGHIELGRSNDHLARFDFGKVQ